MTPSRPYTLTISGSDRVHTGQNENPYAHCDTVRERVELCRQRRPWLGTGRKDEAAAAAAAARFRRGDRDNVAWLRSAAYCVDGREFLWKEAERVVLLLSQHGARLRVAERLTQCCHFTGWWGPFNVPCGQRECPYCSLHLMVKEAREAAPRLVEGSTGTLVKVILRPGDSLGNDEGRKEVCTDFVRNAVRLLRERWKVDGELVSRGGVYSKHFDGGAFHIHALLDLRKADNDLYLKARQRDLQKLIDEVSGRLGLKRRTVKMERLELRSSTTLKHAAEDYTVYMGKEYTPFERIGVSDEALLAQLKTIRGTRKLIPLGYMRLPQPKAEAA